MKDVELADGKTINGGGRLTNAIIDQLQIYYGMAIRSNVGNLEQMKRAVWATFFHKQSTDDEPYHNLRPNSSDSWCRYKRSLEKGSEYTHKNSLPVAVGDAIKPVYRDLAHPTLLFKCLHGKT